MHPFIREVLLRRDRQAGVPLLDFDHARSRSAVSKSNMKWLGGSGLSPFSVSVAITTLIGVNEAWKVSRATNLYISTSGLSASLKSWGLVTSLVLSAYYVAWFSLFKTLVQEPLTTVHLYEEAANNSHRMRVGTGSLLL